MNEHYAVVLAEFEQMKKDAEDGIRAIKSLIMRPLSSSASAKQKQRPKVRAGPLHEPNVDVSDEGDPKSATSQILEFWQRSPSILSVKQISEGTGLNPKTVGSALWRLSHGENPKASRAARGRYRLKRPHKQPPGSKDDGGQGQA